MRFASLDGELVFSGSEPISLPTSDQDRRFREAFWLHLLEGAADPTTGRTRRYRQSEIARLFNVSDATVMRGLSSARLVREQVAEVAFA